ncbi:M14 family metallopeptidase [Oceanibacterium hippocampi]|uniref:Zinc carboxypeptidase n=1 Tax=Oceanibacterium hippocampi TaxID=745714 RepID=A0A1Y5U058_9PROT|nr:M14 family metallopeptidase [Oceanibacterium hippocampi]SLN77719.1 hypothetical protein OCH7691_04520 [Oceanibacterium hippocampi]
MRVMFDFGTDIHDCFSADYAEARGKFLAAAEAAGAAAMRAYLNPNKGPDGETLATDTAWFGPDDARAVLVMIAATHGVEGFTGSGAMVDWMRIGGPERLPEGSAALLVHAINPYGFAWLRRVTEEGVDLNRNWVDFAEPLPDNPGYDELADAFVPTALDGAVFDAAEAKIAAWREKHGERAFQIARGGGQYRHPSGMFFGGTAPTWARGTLESIIADNDLASRRMNAVIDYHTGLGPFSYGEPISGNRPGSKGHALARQWVGESLTEPDLGTSSSVPKVGMSEFGWTRAVGDRHVYVALEYGTYSPELGRLALREDHWLHAYGRLDWASPETQRIKARIRHHYYPATDDWREMVIFRSRQMIGAMQRGLATL